MRVDEQEKIEGTLDGIRMDTIEKHKGQLLKETPLTIAGRPGRYINWRTEKGAIWQAQYFLAGYRIYMLSFGVPDEAAPEEIKKFRESLAGKFFDSFRLVSTKPVKQRSEFEATTHPKRLEWTHACEAFVRRYLGEPLEPVV